MFEIKSPWMMLAGIALLTVVLLRRWRRYYHRRRRNHADEDLLRRMQTAPTRRDIPLHDAPAEVLGWHVEMYDTARDLMGELNSKLAALQQLNMMADAAAERLEAALQRAPESEQETEADPMAVVENIVENDDPAAVLDSLTSKPTPQLGNDPRCAGVYGLADRGLVAEEIALQLDEPIGDVEFILSVRVTRDPIASA